MNTIREVLQAVSKKDNEGYYKTITIHTRGGKEFNGSLAHWDILKSPNLVKIVSSAGITSFVNVSDIEAISA